MESYKLKMRKSQYAELYSMLRSCLRMRPELQMLHYAELYLLYQALRRFAGKIGRMNNEFKKNDTRVRSVSFNPPEGMIITLVLTWIKPQTHYAQITLNDFFDQVDQQSDELQKFMVGKMYAGENQNDILENFRQLKFKW